MFRTTNHRRRVPIISFHIHSMYQDHQEKNMVNYLIYKNKVVQS